MPGWNAIGYDLPIAYDPRQPGSECSDHMAFHQTGNDLLSPGRAAHAGDFRPGKHRIAVMMPDTKGAGP